MSFFGWHPEKNHIVFFGLINKILFSSWTFLFFVWSEFTQIWTFSFCFDIESVRYQKLYESYRRTLMMPSFLVTQNFFFFSFFLFINKVFLCKCFYPTFRSAFFTPFDQNLDSFRFDIEPVQALTPRPPHLGKFASIMYSIEKTFLELKLNQTVLLRRMTTFPLVIVAAILLAVASYSTSFTFKRYNHRRRI